MKQEYYGRYCVFLKVRLNKVLQRMYLRKIEVLTRDVTKAVRVREGVSRRFLTKLLWWLTSKRKNEETWKSSGVPAVFGKKCFAY